MALGLHRLSQHGVGNCHNLDLSELLGQRTTVTAMVFHGLRSSLEPSRIPLRERAQFSPLAPQTFTWLAAQLGLGQSLQPCGCDRRKQF